MVTIPCIVLVSMFKRIWSGPSIFAMALIHGYILVVISAIASIPVSVAVIMLIRPVWR